jgi:hypothetical protein
MNIKKHINMIGIHTQKKSENIKKSYRNICFDRLHEIAHVVFSTELNIKKSFFLYSVNGFFFSP